MYSCTTCARYLSTLPPDSKGEETFNHPFTPQPLEAIDLLLLLCLLSAAADSHSGLSFRPLSFQLANLVLHFIPFQSNPPQDLSPLLRPHQHTVIATSLQTLAATTTMNKGSGRRSLHRDLAIRYRSGHGILPFSHSLILSECDSVARPVSDDLSHSQGQTEATQSDSLSIPVPPCRKALRREDDEAM